MSGNIQNRLSNVGGNQMQGRGNAKRGGRPVEDDGGYNRRNQRYPPPTHHRQQDQQPYGGRQTEIVSIRMPNSRSVVYEDFKVWMERKTRKSLSIVRHNWSRGLLELTVAEEDVQPLLRLNGFTYIDQRLDISAHNQQQHLPQSQTTSNIASKTNIPAALTSPEILTLIRSFLESRFDADRNILNLSAVQDVPQLMEKLTMMNTGAWNAILNVVSQCCPQVSTISFENNQLRTLYPLQGLASFIPNVANLSFAGNQISELKSLPPVLGQLKNLREVVLIGNPAAEHPNYRRQMARDFPTLQFLDTLPLSGAEGGTEVKLGGLNSQQQQNILVDEEVRLPLDPSGSFFDSQETHSMVAQFLIKYIHLFDTDRASLIDVYNSSATFSHSINSVTPACRKPRVGRTDWLINPDHDFSLSRPNRSPNWRDSARSTESGHSSSSNSSNRRSGGAINARRSVDKTIFVGPIDIVHQLSHLPQTQHKHPQTYLIDSWQFQNVGMPPELFINIHGQLTDESKLDRYFDRLFVLLPAAVGSKAQISGWPVEIINDVLCIRAFTDEDALRRIRGRGGKEEDVRLLSVMDKLHASPVVIGKGAVVSSAAAAQQPQQSQQQQLSVELSQQTGLNYNFSQMCLAEQGWDKAKALHAFQMAKMENRIPPEAYIQ